MLDIGAGRGALTLPLARTGARVIAIERDARVARTLAVRMSPWPRVSVVVADALVLPLPRRPFQVVANIPFGITMALLRRLVVSPMWRADLVVEHSTGRRLAACPPTRRELARWHRRFAFSLGPVLPAHLFTPAPPVNAVVLRLRRRGSTADELRTT